MTEQVRRLLAELLGAFFLLFFGGLAVISSDGSLLVISFGFGLGLMAGLYAYGEISGGHFNPAVSLGALLDNRIDVATFVQYVVAQIAGALLAGLALLWATNQEAVASTATVPAEGVGAGSAFLLELILTAIFVGVILKVTTSELNGVTAFLGISLTLVVVHIASARFTGTSVNPARTLGSAVIGNEYTDIWVFLIAPFLGAALGWALYQVTVGKMSMDRQAT
jgi:aquaporin Z